MLVSTFLPGVWAYFGGIVFWGNKQATPCSHWTVGTRLSCSEWKEECSCVNANSATPLILRSREQSFASFIH